MMCIRLFDNITENYDIEENGLESEDTESSAVVIPEFSFQLTTEHLQQLQNQVNPLQASKNYGIKLYEQTLQFICYKIVINTHIVTTTCSDLILNEYIIATNCTELILND